jgi:hypothetical protein
MVRLEHGCCAKRPEAQAVERSLRYWLEDAGDDPLSREASVDVDFDC